MGSGGSKVILSYCSVERTNLQLIHKEIVHKKITELNVLYSMSKLILIWNDTNIDLYTTWLKLSHGIFYVIRMASFGEKYS